MPPHSTSPSPFPREIQARPGFRRPSRQKTPAIVHDQGISRLRMKNNNAISRAPTARPHTSPGQRPGFVPGMPSALKGRSIPPKTPVIVHDQGISRHPQKTTPPLGSLLLGAALELGGWNLELPRPIPFALKPQQSRLIVPHQGKCKKAYGYLFGQSTRWIGRTVGRMPKRMPGKNPLLGERTQVREGVPLNCLAASPCLHRPIKAENPNNRA